MGILVDKNSRLLVQGITGREGLFHSAQMLAYGSRLVAGTSPGKGGDWVLDGKVPVFDTVMGAVDSTGANVSVVFVPARFAADAMLEAADAGIAMLVCITEGIPIQDMMQVTNFFDRKGARLIGPNGPGILTAGQCKAGIIPGDITMPGNVGVVSRSGTLTYEVLNALKLEGMGTSTCVGIGGDPVIGTSFTDVLRMFEADPHTEKVVLIGEIGGSDEERAARYIADHMTKKVVAFIAGRSAPAGKRMGHAGAIVEGGTGGAEEKMRALEESGVRVAERPDELPELLK
jgi:succinyl-CoA synthetase alpha subunit